MVGKVAKWLMRIMFQKREARKHELPIMVTWPNKVPGLIDSSYVARAIRRGGKP